MRKGLKRALSGLLGTTVFFAVFFASYVLLVVVFQIKTPEPVQPASEAEGTQLQEPDWEPEALRKQLLLVRGEDERFVKLWAEFLDAKKQTVTWIALPVDTKLTLSDSLYRTLCGYQPELPQILKLSELGRLFSDELLCMAAEEIMGELLHVPFGGCTVIKEEAYSMLLKGETFDTQLPVKETLLALADGAVTDISIQERLVYTETYLSLKAASYRELPGETGTEAFYPDAERIKALTEELCDGADGG